MTNLELALLIAAAAIAVRLLWPIFLAVFASFILVVGGAITLMGGGILLVVFWLVTIFEDVGWFIKRKYLIKKMIQGGNGQKRF